MPAHETLSRAQATMIAPLARIVAQDRARSGFEPDQEVSLSSTILVLTATRGEAHTATNLPGEDRRRERPQGNIRSRGFAAWAGLAGTRQVRIRGEPPNLLIDKTRVAIVWDEPMPGFQGAVLVCLRTNYNARYSADEARAMCRAMS